MEVDFNGDEEVEVDFSGDEEVGVDSSEGEEIDLDALDEGEAAEGADIPPLPVQVRNPILLGLPLTCLLLLASGVRWRGRSGGGPAAGPKTKP